MAEENVRGKRRMEESEGSGFSRLGMRLADWSEKWFPDAFVFALVGLLIVFVAGLFAGVGTRNLIKYFGDGFWGLIPFTMQMAMIIIGGFVVATSPPVHKLIKKLAKVPRTPRGAVAFVVRLRRYGGKVHDRNGPGEVLAGLTLRR